MYKSLATRCLFLFSLFVASISTGFGQVLITSTGVSNTFSINFPANISTIKPGFSFTFFSNQSITGPAFININSTGSVSLLKNTNQLLVANDIISGQPVTIIFDGTNWQIVDGASSNASQWINTTGSGIYFNNNVGIATSSPSQRLDINGGARIRNLSSTGFNIVQSDANGNLSLNTLVPTVGIWTISGSNIFQQTLTNRIGIGLSAPVNLLDISGGAVIGTTYAGTNTAPANGLLVQGNVGIGTTAPSTVLDVAGGGRIRSLSSTGFNIVQSDANGNLSLNTLVPTVGVWTISGTNIFQQTLTNRVGIGVTTPQNLLDIEGGAVIGAAYSGTNAAPTNGLLVQGNVGIGTTAPSTALDVAGGGRIRSLSSTGFNIVQADANGNLSLNTMVPTVGVWTISGTNIFQQTLTNRVGIGVATPLNLLDIEGGAVIGATYAGTNTAPTNGLLVQGSIGIGTTSVTRAYVEQSGLIGNTAAIFGGGSTGIALIAAFPSIGFNSYYNAGYKAISAGFGGNISLDPGTGDFAFQSSSASAAINAAHTVSTKLTIKNNGDLIIPVGNKIGVGVTPTATLDVSAGALGGNARTAHANIASSNTWGTSVNISNTSSGGSTYSLISTGADHPLGAGSYVVQDASSNYAFVFNSATGDTHISPSTSGGASVGIGFATPSTDLNTSYKFLVNGASCGSSWTNCSDFRYKKDIITIPSALESIRQMRGVFYDWRIEDFPEMNFEKRQQVGVIAQEIETYYPQLVITDQKGYKSVDYPKLTPILLQAVKELDSVVVHQQADLNKLKVENGNLREQMLFIKSYLGIADSTLSRSSEAKVKN